MRWALVAALLAAAAGVPHAQAQLPELPALPEPGELPGQGTGLVWDFELRVPAEQVELPTGRSVDVTLTVVDKSRDGPGVAGPGITYSPSPHTIAFTARPMFEDTAGWFHQQPIGVQTFAGETKTTAFPVRVDPNASNPYYGLEINATMRTNAGVETSRVATILFHSPGLGGFSLRPGGTLELRPYELEQASVIVVNANNQPRTFSVEVTGNPCKMSIGAPASFVVDGRTTKEVGFSVQAPRDRFWFNSLDCTFNVRATSHETGHSQASIVSVQVTGFYVAIEWVFWFVVLALAILLLVLLVKRRKERLEEEILGKPQRPWTIPVEEVYLRHLREKDPRAWYVVRHYLMEDEYRSSLLWYKAYKKATKGSRTKERVILRHEKDYERFKAKWQRRIAKPLAQADRFEANLQRKLDRKAKRGLRKRTRRHESQVARIEKAHAAREAREMAAWEKASAKAAKKGGQAPPRPEVAPPELPDAPGAKGVALAEHRWGRKAARFRRRRVKRQGNLEVRFEKADARKLARVKRRVQRVGRRLDDPAFAAEHPLLQ